ncbi:MAG TPA: 2-hydroxymuconate tautomerase [Terriglobales bacterium]|nr:2-hydroxymuconate tautomerase [Terriglobales bacterium]
MSWCRVGCGMVEMVTSPSMSNTTMPWWSRVLMSMSTAFAYVFIRRPPESQSETGQICILPLQPITVEARPTGPIKWRNEDLPPSLLEWGRKEPDMPLIEIHLMEGRTDEQKRALLSSVTTAVHESIGAPLESIRVWVQEISPKEYMAAGVLAADKRK